jgi:hypothetical protein
VLVGRGLTELSEFRYGIRRVDPLVRNTETPGNAIVLGIGITSLQTLGAMAREVGISGEGYLPFFLCQSRHVGKVDRDDDKALGEFIQAKSVLESMSKAWCSWTGGYLSRMSVALWNSLSGRKRRWE